jgi:hypothetical protein
MRGPTAVMLAIVGLGHTGTGAPPTPGRCVLRPSLYVIDLTATARAPGAKGVARLRPAATPFGLPVTVDGHLVLEVTVSAEGLPSPASLGPYTTYVAWASMPTLDEVRRLGAVTDQPAIGRVAWNKFMVFVSAEPSGVRERWSGPIVLRGMSASGYMQNFSAHPLFNGGVPPC